MLLSVLLWTLMIQSTSLVYRGTLRLVVSQGCFPPIGPWTYTATDTSLVSRDVKGPSLWGSSPLGGSGGQRCPEPFYIHHCSPFSSDVAVSQHCAQFILLTGSTYRFRSFISSFCPPHLSLRLCQFVGFHSGLFFNVFVAKPFDTSRNVDITLRS